MKLATAVYLIVGLINLYAQFIGDQTINQFTKPVLMPVLIYLIFLKAKGFVNLPRLLLALALIFAWIGDMLLLNQSDEMFFLGGLGSFLVMQVLYCVVFYKAMNSSQQPKPALWSPFLVFFIVVSCLAYLHAGAMWLPITIYAITILSMLVFAVNRKDQTDVISFRLALLGAALFVISDSLIGLNKFIVEIPQASFLIMLTYIPAQYLIMAGVMKYDNN
ncbi:lysoplasmalogenase [Marinoscillum sp.]|uniref:lysoplasmalogenase n=1 Tax=Marinoscillum sp. TaxID=2024838 RepID=UPI003BA88703